MAQDAVKYKVVVIGGSAGSLDTILKIVGCVNITNDIFYIVVIHRKNDADSVLSNLFASYTNLKVKEVEDKDAIESGCVYIAPADYHLLLDDQHTFSLDSSEKVYYSRPSIDVTFESVAEIFGASAIGILLSGANADGAYGLSRMKQARGYTIVQNPLTAEVGYMPKQAIELLQPDAIVNGEEISEIINSLIS